MDLFVLRAVLGLDTSGYDEGIDKAGKKASTFGDVLKANLVTKGVEVAAKGMVKLGKATVDMVSKSVDAYANYEQLVGGVETLFGQAANQVEKYAEMAYKTAGLSANEYMETVTSFSASLIQSLGGDTTMAAHLADMAITDMSDNANKMGTDMAAIQNAYQGFAKQNYTMLDNLKLGYGGTKSEMDRLIKDAMKLDKSFSVTVKKSKKGAKELEYSYADIVKAIHIVQNEMGITGTTAEEASKTISGSLSSLKASWENLITALGEGNSRKIKEAISRVVDNAETYINNLLPVIENALDGIVILIERLAPVIADKLPGMLDRILPSLTKVTATLIVAFTKALIENLPVIIEAGKQILTEVFKALSEYAPGLMPVLLGVGALKVSGTISSIMESLGGLSTALKGVETAALAAFDALMILYDYQALKEANDTYKAANEAFNNEIETALDSYVKLYNEKGKEVADEWANMVYQIDTTGMSMQEAQTALSNKISGLWDGVPRNMWDGFKAGWNDYFGADGKGLGSLLGDAFTGAVNGVKNILGIHSPSTVFENIGINLMQGFQNGISSLASQILNYVTGFVNSIINKFKSALQIGSPSKVMESYGRFIDEGLARGILKSADEPINALGDIGNAMTFDTVQPAGTRGQPYVVPHSASAGRSLTVILELDKMVLGRAVYQLNNEETQRMGVRLAGVNA